MERKKNKAILLALKSLVSISVLTLIVSKIGLDSIVNTLRNLNPFYFIMASLLYIGSIYASSIRWRVLLKVEGIENMGINRLFSLYLIGSFFNNLLPGIIGGDSVRIYYLYKDIQKGSSSLGSVLADRYTGFVALLLLGLLALSIKFREIEGTGVEYLLLIITCLFVVGSILFFRFRIGDRFGTLRGFYDYFHRLFHQPSIFLHSIAYSLLVQIFIVLSVFSISVGMNLEVSLFDIFLLLPIVVTVTTVPVSLSGIGLREGAFIILFGKVGLSPENATALSFTWFLSYSIASLTGLIFYLQWRSKDG